MSTILCGFPDETVARQPPSAFDSYVGGTPTSFLSPERYSFPQPQCPSCEEPMSFIMQIYGQVDANRRVLYFFSCPSRSCQTCCRFCRVYRLTTVVPEPKPVVNEKISDLIMAVSEWELNSDDADGMELSLNLDNNCLRGGETSSVASVESKPFHAINHLVSPFKCYYINVFGEESADSPRSNNLSSWILDYEAEEEFVDEDEGIEGPITTSYYQQHLATRNISCGLEPIRYSWEGKPIFTTASPSVDWESHLLCSRCGGCRVFEVQLFPTINSYLHLKKGKCVDKDGGFFNAVWPLNFSTLIVFSCKANCQSTNGEWVEECVLVQNDEGESLFIDDN